MVDFPPDLELMKQAQTMYSPFAIEKLPKLNFREVPLEVEVEMHFRQ